MALELVNSPREALSEIFDQSINGVAVLLNSMWNKRVVSPKLTIRFTDAYESDREVASQSRYDKVDPFPLPLIDYVVVQIEPAVSRGSRMAMQSGIYTGRSQDKSYARTEKLTPVDVGIGIQFETEDNRQALLFAQIWNQSAPSKSFVVTQPDTGARFHIALKLDPVVQLPQRSASSDEQGKTLRFELNAILETYTGTTSMDALVKKINTFSKDSRSGVLIDSGKIIASNEHWAIGID